MTLPAKLVVIANPGHRRVALLEEAMRRRGWGLPAVVPWLGLASRIDELDELLTPGSFLRLESPGQDFAVEQYLLTLGAAEPEDRDLGADRMTAAEVAALPFERGRVVCPRQWFRGFRGLLAELGRRLVNRPAVRVLNPPADVAVMFDKRDCQRLFRGRGVAVPAALPGVVDFDSLVEAMRAANRRRVFVKLACGSSASGVISLATDGVRMVATTTMQMAAAAGGPRFYNSRKLCRYHRGEDIAAVVNAVCREGAHVEAWIPKAVVGGTACDLRVLVIAGQVRHAVLRRSRTPITNLHLLNQRGDADELRRLMDPAVWDAAMADCQRAAAAFPGSLHAGVDVLFSRSLRRHAVLEANAFGDLLGGVTWNGLTTHEAELAALEGGWA